MIAKGRGRAQRLWAGIMVGEGGSWLGNGYLSFEFLSFRKSGCLVGGLCIAEKLCLQDSFGEGAQDLAAMCQL